jgi:hypothetical protein
MSNNPSLRPPQFTIVFSLLGFLAPTVHNKLLRTLVPLAKSAPWLQSQALELTFVPALFALKGLALLSPNRDIFTKHTRFGLLWKSDYYENAGPAIEYLRERFLR